MELLFTEDGMTMKGQELALGHVEFPLKWSCSVVFCMQAWDLQNFGLGYNVSEQVSLGETGARMKEMKDPRKQQPGN